MPLDAGRVLFHVRVRAARNSRELCPWTVSVRPGAGAGPSAGGGVHPSPSLSPAHFRLLPPPPVVLKGAVVRVLTLSESCSISSAPTSCCRRASTAPDRARGHKYDTARSTPPPDSTSPRACCPGPRRTRRPPAGDRRRFRRSRWRRAQLHLQVALSQIRNNRL